MKISFYRAPWFKGKFFYWSEMRFNNGDVYTGYRIGPLLIQVRNERK